MPGGVAWGHVQEVGPRTATRFHVDRLQAARAGRGRPLFGRRVDSAGGRRRNRGAAGSEATGDQSGHGHATASSGSHRSAQVGQHADDPLKPLALIATCRPPRARPCEPGSRWPRSIAILRPTTQHRTSTGRTIGVRLGPKCADATEMKARAFTFLPTSWTIAGHMAERVAGIVSSVLEISARWAGVRRSSGLRSVAHGGRSALRQLPFRVGGVSTRRRSRRHRDPGECPTIAPCPFALAASTTLRVRKARMSPDTWSRPVRSSSECSRSGITTNSKELFRMSERYRRCSPSRSLWPSVCPATIRTSTPESVKRSKR